MSVDSRKTQLKKRERRDRYRKGVHKCTSRRIADQEQEDPYIQREIDIYGLDNVRVIQ